MKVSASSVKAALSTTTRKREESWSTHFQTSQKVWPSHQCQRRWSTTTEARVTTTTEVQANLMPTVTHLQTWAKINSTVWTTKPQWSKSPIWLTWLLSPEASVASTQTSTCNQYQWASKVATMASTPWAHTCSTNSKCSSHSLRLKVKTKLPAKSNKTRAPKAKVMVKDTRRRTRPLPAAHLPAPNLAKKLRNLSKKNMWPSRRRVKKQPQSKRLTSQLKPTLPNELDRA